MLNSTSTSDGANSSTSLSPVRVKAVVPGCGGGASGPAAIGVQGQRPAASSRTQCRAGNQARSMRIEVNWSVRVSSIVK